MAKKKAFFMICLLAVAFGLTALLVVFAEKREETDGLLCVTSFYPVQLLAESVSEGAEGVTVRNLTENHSGCIHDYTLTTQDMRLLSEAELFLINGGEMELFLERAAAEYKELVIVDTSEGYAFLEGVAHDHDHGEKTPGGSESHAHEADAHAPTINAHIWMDIDGYLLQLSKVEEAFVVADPAQESLYRQNANACREELMQLKDEYDTVKPALAGKETVVFHEGFVYLLRMLDVESVHCLAMDADTQIAAGEAAEILEECELHGITSLFVEAEYAGTITDTFAKELGGEVVILDPVTGSEIPASDDRTEAAEEYHAASGRAEAKSYGVALYCQRMRKNLETIKQAYGLQ